AKRYGVKSVMYSSEEYPELYDLTQKLTSKTKKHVEKIVGDAYNTFLKRVADGRKVSVSKVDTEYAQGRIWSGSQALAIRLVDALGNRDDAIHAAMDLAGLDTSKSYPIIFRHKKPNFLKTCLESPGKCLKILGAQQSHFMAMFMDSSSWLTTRDPLFLPPVSQLSANSFHNQHRHFLQAYLWLPSLLQQQ
ncbi:MAG: S49 family peptidase, partial [Proteobacteria bacterium]|nr:S49 family peptidase [Pseudomonadota bacterium]